MWFLLFSSPPGENERGHDLRCLVENCLLNWTLMRYIRNCLQLSPHCQSTKISKLPLKGAANQIHTPRRSSSTSWPIRHNLRRRNGTLRGGKEKGWKPVEHGGGHRTRVGSLHSHTFHGSWQGRSQSRRDVVMVAVPLSDGRSRRRPDLAKTTPVHWHGETWKIYSN